MAILEADIAWFFLPDYHRLVLPQQERVDQPDKKHAVIGSSLIIIDW